MSEKAYHGLAGDVVRAIGPHSEADPVALLIQFLVCAGNVIGNCPYYQVESDHHRANLFVTLVGNTAKGRKGTSMGRIGAITKPADEQWHGDRTKSGLSSGEGLIHQVRDEVTRWKGADWEGYRPRGRRQAIDDHRAGVRERPDSNRTSRQHAFSHYPQCMGWATA